MPTDTQTDPKVIAMVGTKPSAPISPTSIPNMLLAPTTKEVPPRNIKIKDGRAVDSATGQMLNEKNRMDSSVDIELAKRIISAAKKHGIDPTTALSIGLNETGLALPKNDTHTNSTSKYAALLQGDPYKRANPFMVNGGDEIIDEKGISHPVGGESLEKDGAIETFMKVFNSNLGRGKKLGKKDEADLIQAYNGYGTLKGKGVMYGIDTNTNPIDTNKNPIYGKKILDLRENVIKKSPELMSLIESTK